MAYKARRSSEFDALRDNIHTRRLNPSTQREAVRFFFRRASKHNSALAAQTPRVSPSVAARGFPYVHMTKPLRVKFSDREIARSRFGVRDAVFCALFSESREEREEHSCVCNRVATAVHMCGVTATLRGVPEYALPMFSPTQWGRALNAAMRVLKKKRATGMHARTTQEPEKFGCHSVLVHKQVVVHVVHTRGVLLSS